MNRLVDILTVGVNLLWGVVNKFDQGRFTTILDQFAPQSFSIFRRSMIQSDDLPLREMLDSSLIAKAFEEDKVSFGLATDDVFTPALTLWGMVSQSLFQGAARSCKAAAGRVAILLAATAKRVVAQNAGNYCRAKAKIPVSTIRKITLRLGTEAERKSLEYTNLQLPPYDSLDEERLTPKVITDIRAVPVEGRIIIADGFTVDAPDTPANQAQYPQSSSQAEGLGFPMIRCVGLVSMLTGLLLDLGYAAYSGKGTGETSILRQLRSSLKKGDILVADSYYCTYWLIAMCINMGVHVVMKNHHKRSSCPLGSKRLSATERTTKWTRPSRPEEMTAEEYEKVPEFIDIRLSDIATDDPNSRCQQFTVASTMLDVEEFPKTWIGSLYKGRWMCESDISSVKCALGLEYLRGQSPEALEREIWTTMLTYNLIRLKMLQSGYTAQREIRSMSFTESLQLLASNWLLCACMLSNEAMVACAQLQSVVAVIGNRPGRAEPRENKRRPKILKLTTEVQCATGFRA